MLRTLTIVTALSAALASPAFAASVSVSLTGKSEAAIAADVAKAAAYVCRDAVSSPLIPEAKKSCVADTIAATHAKIAGIYASAPSTTVASR